MGNILGLIRGSCDKVGYCSIDGDIYSYIGPESLHIGHCYSDGDVYRYIGRDPVKVGHVNTDHGDICSYFGASYLRVGYCTSNGCIYRYLGLPAHEYELVGYNDYTNPYYWYETGGAGLLLFLKPNENRAV
jgi:hypothetical protein